MLNYLLITFGLILSISGIYWLSFLLNRKVIEKFKLQTPDKIIAFNKTGLYGINILGGSGFMGSNKFKIKLLNIETDELIKIKVNKLKATGFKSFEYALFKIKETGKYRIELIKPQTLVVMRKDEKLAMMKTSTFFPHQQSNTRIPTKNLSISIKKSIPNYQKTLGIVFTVSGINMISFAIQNWILY